MEDRHRPTDEGRRTKDDRPSLAFVFRLSSIVVVVAMLLFAVWFSAYSIRLHEAHRTHKADLGQIDLAIWNTAHGRFVQEIKDDQVSTRLTDHVEPIFLLVAPVFWLWDDVRALLILQAVALALGAWPIYLLARKKLSELALSPIDAAAPNVKRQTSTSRITHHSSFPHRARTRHSSLVTRQSFPGARSSSPSPTSSRRRCKPPPSPSFTRWRWRRSSSRGRCGRSRAAAGASSQLLPSC